MRGKIRARVDETRGGYAKGEIVVMGPHDIVPRDRLYPCINCGMVPLARDVARGKLEALGAGAALVRRELAS